ncbi:MAG: Na(+)/H(+) antiporter subunit B [Planctomycetes bacterium]|nr:Na(+)/H(+) antiporter subunit B [Planctomycetota bacterium]
MEEQVVVRLIAKMLIPYILMFGFYVIAHGELGPGGGFQGGVIIASAYILYCLVFGLEAGRRAIPRGLIDALMALGVLLYASVGLLGLFRGAAFLDYRALGADMATASPLGMTLVETGVGFTVASVMIIVFDSMAGLRLPTDAPPAPPEREGPSSASRAG